LPKNVVLFVWLCFAANGCSLLGAGFGPPETQSLNMLAGVLIVIAISALLVWLAAWQRLGWARWPLVALTLLSVPFFYVTPSTYYSQYPIFMSLQTLSIGLDVLSICYLFTGDARAWFA
jgi:hypothetical protein